ncbi:MAG: putative DNA-binding domain-containing protein [Hydrogenophaga sp.]|nr:putative DNA-binding domain-containing protein [Hydrogenophaga sp.]
MSTLAASQRALLDALFQPQPPQADACWNPTGLGAYRANAHAHAERTLSGTYPVVRALLGDEAFNALARALWHRHPPLRGDLGEWGEALALFIATEPDLDPLPYLGDVARVEWALHQAARSPDARPDPASFARLQDHHPDRLHARLATGTWVLDSAWPVLSIVDAHLHGDPGFDAVAQRLRDGVREAVRVWRHAGRVRACFIDAPTARFEARLLAGHSLGRALGEAPIDDLPAWLTEAVQAGRLLGFGPPHDTHTPTPITPPGDTA